MKHPRNKKIIQEVPARWKSTYYMIERFLELRSVVNNTIIRHKNAPPMLLTASELSILSAVLQILRPIEVATKKVSGDKYCTSSKVIPLIHCLLLKVKPLKVEESLAQELNKRDCQENGCYKESNSSRYSQSWTPGLRKCLRSLVGRLNV